MTVSNSNSNVNYNGAGGSIFDYLNSLQTQQNNQQYQQKIQEYQNAYQNAIQQLKNYQPTQPEPPKPEKTANGKPDWPKLLEHFAWALTSGSLTKNIGLGLLGGLYGPTLYDMILKKSGGDKNKNNNNTTQTNPNPVGQAAAVDETPPETQPLPTGNQTTPPPTTSGYTGDVGLSIPTLESWIDKYNKLYGNLGWGTALGQGWNPYPYGGNNNGLPR